jgi:hypothetical protein
MAESREEPSASEQVSSEGSPMRSAKIRSLRSFGEVVVHRGDQVRGEVVAESIGDCR